MKVSHPVLNYADARGEITDILVKENIEAVTLITLVRGATRGNHYHKETVQYLFVVQGKLKMLTRMPDQPIVVTILEKGDLAVTDHMEHHAFTALEDSAFIVLTRGLRGGKDYEKDTYRLSEPLHE